MTGKIKIRVDEKSMLGHFSILTLRKRKCGESEKKLSWNRSIIKIELMQRWPLSSRTICAKL